ncbi:neuraminidase-like domain-containing protein [Morganella morganii]|uniref:Tc toxin subunit A-related protein n=1 Tax=Morganella morganii TaxID=582 RepID=UPI00339C4C91
MPRNVKQILNHLAENKRDAYVDYFTNYVMGKNENTAMLGITDADDLYDYFLTDVRTSADFETSNVSDALASVQQYINNILNQKEPGYSGEFSEDINQWWSGYLGHISLWKAYQKMEDYPEDYNLPDYVTDKTNLFSDFAADLGSNSLNDATIQTAFLKYLRSYEAVNAISVISGYVDYPGQRSDNDIFSGHGFLNSDYFFIGKNNSSPAGFYWREANIRADKSSDYISPRAWQEWQPLTITEDANNILQMRIVKVSGCLFIVYLIGKEEAVADKEKTAEGIRGENKKIYKVTLKLSRMGLDGKWDIPEQLFEKIYDSKPAKKSEDKNEPFRLISVAFTQDEQRDDYLVIAWLDNNNVDNSKNIIFHDVLNVIRQKLAINSSDILGAKWPESLASRFFSGNNNHCQHRIFGVEKDISSIRGVDSDPNLSLEAFYSLKDSRHQLRVRGICHRSAKIPDLISLHLQAVVSTWNNGRIIVSGDRNNITVRAEATEGAEYLALLLSDKKVIEFNKGDFAEHNGWLSAKKTLSLSQEQCDLIAVKNYKEIRSGAGFSYQIKSGGSINSLVHVKNHVSTEMQPIVVPAELSILNDKLAGLKEENWEGKLIYQKGSHTPWCTFSWENSELKTNDEVRFKFGLTSEGVKGEFKIEISQLSRDIPVIETFSEHQQFLTFNQSESELKHVRLNSVQVRDLIYRAQIAVRHIFDWDAQMTEEPAYGDKGKETLDLYGANSRYLWELFFYLPYLVASRFSQNRLYYQARQWLHYIFSPYEGHRLSVKDDKDGSELLPPPYWNCRVLTQADLKYQNNDNALPDPFAISEDAPSHYRKSVYLMYVDTLISEADLNYRQLSRDSITRAWGLYHHAQGMLGRIPKERSLPKWQPCTVSELLDNEKYSVQENTFPELFSGIYPENIPKQLSGFFWYGSLGNERFRLPVQNSLLDRQSVLDQRLFNLRHYLDIEGNMMQLPLYAAALDPFDLLRSRQGGTSELAYVQSGSLNIPSYCFRAMLEKAKEQAAALITLGDKRLSYYEQKERYHTENMQLNDAIALAEASAGIQSSLLAQQNATLLSLKAALTMAVNKQKYYRKLSADGTSTKERDARNLLVSGSVFQSVTSGAIIAAGIVSAFPRVFGLAQDTGDHGKGALLAIAGTGSLTADILRGSAEYVQLDEQYRRRQEEWNFSAEQAENEIEVLNEQIKAQEVAITAAENSVKYTSLLQTQAQNLYDYFSQTRQVNESLYEKMANIIGLLHDQLCSLVRTFCALTEASWRYETDDYKRQTFIPADLWSGDNLGALVGVKLQKSLLEMEMAYTQQNTRRLNITKTISLKSLVSNQQVKTDETPLATWADVKKALKEAKKLSFDFSHQSFDTDFPGHYARKIHSLSVTFPTLLPPYQNMRVLLEQTSNTLLVSPDIDAVKSLYTPTDQINSESIVRNLRINQKIILSRGSDDNGEFPEDAFTGGQYHSFEYSGAVSHWRLSVPRPQSCPELIDNLNDIIIKLNYTAKSGNDAFEAAVNELLESTESVKAGYNVND